MSIKLIAQPKSDHPKKANCRAVVRLASADS